MLDDALKRRSEAETHETLVQDGYLVSRERPGGREKKDAYEAALQKARRELGLL
ncbi:hypothetical protein QSU92_04660 [Microbacterium sp. ET2]|uniref:hypothetical protein n=1 Tax=Microbacterium albipurpureum TaxID=3050384 RepID=UPI00259C944B|nr:hypothetical protein [Microbacterium sp. ET2 (Ac-2212)]WJL96477.1 hypothetical protein QSU92_04660 [Microbacterium sp. ET2 (Ac-2212)]